MVEPRNERYLAAIAVALGAKEVPGWSRAEGAITRNVPSLARGEAAQFAREIRRGRDPLGTSFCRLRSPEERRPSGATYTPNVVVRAMVRWAARTGDPSSIIDPGVGSARFLVAAGKRFPNAMLIGVETDPLAALIARAHVKTVGFEGRTRIIVGDYRSVQLPVVSGPRLFIGNPPYVRHHLISSEWKDWLVASSRSLGVREASQLAGLHAYFFVATAQRMREGDYGTFVTAAEWLDVNYGRIVRD